MLNKQEFTNWDDIFDEDLEVCQDRKSRLEIEISRFERNLTNCVEEKNKRLYR